MQIPNRDSVTTDEFIAFMEYVWSDRMELADDGMVIYHACGDEIYDEFQHAVKTATKLGAHRTGGTILHGDRWECYMFLNGNQVRIKSDGSGVTPKTVRYAERKKN